MRFWKFISDGSGQSEESSQQTGSSQEISNSLSEQSESQENSSQLQSDVSLQSEESSQQTGSSQEISNSSSEQSESQENSSQLQSDGSLQSEESSQQTGNSQEISNSSSEQSESQENSSQLQSDVSLQSEESSQQTGSSQEISNSLSEQSESQEKSSQLQSDGSGQSQEPSQQTGNFQKDKKVQQDNNSQNQDEIIDDVDDSKSDNTDKNNEVQTEEQIQQISEDISNNPKLTFEQKKELLEKLKNSIEEIRKRKAEKLQKEYLRQEKQEVEESKEEKYDLSEQTNNFLNQLEELPSFDDRDRGAGYSINTESSTEVPDSVIRTLISRFLNQRFCSNNSDLNTRSNSLEKSKGFYKWEIKDVIVHLKTHQLTKVLTDKYGYEYAQGKSEDVPLSFYFDMSGSMSSFTNMLAVIAIELLKKEVKVLIGFNERVNVQIESIEKNITVFELAEILESAGYLNGWGNSGRDSYKKDARVKFKYIERNLDNYLIDKKAEKCVVFADFDPRREVINLSQVADVYWFCFEKGYTSYDLVNFNGFIYKVRNVKDLEQGLVMVNKKRFETLCYTDNPSGLQKKGRVRK